SNGTELRANGFLAQFRLALDAVGKHAHAEICPGRKQANTSGIGEFTVDVTDVRFQRPVVEQLTVAPTQVGDATRMGKAAVRIQRIIDALPGASIVCTHPRGAPAKVTPRHVDACIIKSRTGGGRTGCKACAGA